MYSILKLEINKNITHKIHSFYCLKLFLSAIFCKENSLFTLALLNRIAINKSQIPKRLLNDQDMLDSDND